MLVSATLSCDVVQAVATAPVLDGAALVGVGSALAVAIGEAFCACWLAQAAADSVHAVMTSAPTVAWWNFISPPSAPQT